MYSVPPGETLLAKRSSAVVLVDHAITARQQVAAAMWAHHCQFYWATIKCMLCFLSVILLCIIGVGGVGGCMIRVVRHECRRAQGGGGGAARGCMIEGQGWRGGSCTFSRQSVCNSQAVTQL